MAKTAIKRKLKKTKTKKIAKNTFFCEPFLRFMKTLEEVMKYHNPKGFVNITTGKKPDIRFCMKVKKTAKISLKIQFSTFSKSLLQDSRGGP